MSWKGSIQEYFTNPGRFTTFVLLLTTLYNVASARPPSGMPFAPSADPFAPPNPPPPSNYAPSYQTMNQFSMQPPPPQMPQQPPQQPMAYNQPQYMPTPNQAYAPISQGPPPGAAPVGATAPSSSTGEMEFESGQGNNGGWGGGTSSNYVYPPTYPQAYPSQPRPGQYASPSLLDAYYRAPYAQGQRYYQYQMQQRNRNDIFGGMFGSTPSGNMFGALMLNELVF